MLKTSSTEGQMNNAEAPPIDSGETCATQFNPKPKGDLCATQFKLPQQGYKILNGRQSLTHRHGRGENLKTNSTEAQNEQRRGSSNRHRRGLRCALQSETETRSRRNAIQATAQATRHPRGGRKKLETNATKAQMNNAEAPRI